MAIKIAMLLVFFVMMISVGVYTRKKITGVNEFVIGGRSVGPWLTAFSYGTSYFSAVIFVGYAGQFGWKFGLSSTWIGIGNALLGSLLAWLVLGKRTRIMTQHLNSNTMADFFGKRYNSKALKLFAATIVFIFLIPYTASLYNGLSRLFEQLLGVDYAICVIAMAVLTAVYVVLGGYMATSLTDFIQGIIMLFGIVAVIVAVLNGNGGLVEAVKSMSEVSDAQNAAGAFTKVFGPDPMSLLSVVILTSLGTWGLPQMVNKFYAIKDAKAIKTGTIVSTFFALVVAGGCYFLGGFGRLYEPALKADGSIDFDSIIPLMINGLPDIILGIVLVLVLSASMSTLASLVLTSSSTLTLDLFKGTIVKDMNEKRQLLVMRAFLVVFIAISVAIALNKDKVPFIAQLMAVSWGALAGAFLAPFLYGLFWKGVTKTAVCVNFIIAPCFMVGNVLFGKYYPTLLQSPLNAGAFIMVISLIIVPLVSLFTKKQDEKQLEEIYSFKQN